MEKYGYLFFLTVLVACSCNNPESKSKVDSDWTLLGFRKADQYNPIMAAGDSKFLDPILKKEVLWDEKDVFNPAVVVRDGKVWMLFRAEDKIGKYAGTSRIGLAESIDGIKFVKQKVPVLFPQNDTYKIFEWEGGIEDPRVVEDQSGTYVMTYTAYDGDKARLMIATSKDLVNWSKKGHAFANSKDQKYVQGWSKSGSIVSRYHPDGRIVAEKVNGKYWMYYGDTYLWLATSDDLINWMPVKSDKEQSSPAMHFKNMYPELKIALSPRIGKFDSDLVEPGPPAMITDKGILLIYNSRNNLATGDSTLKEHTYTAAQALFDLKDPGKLIKRMDNYFMKPDRPYETQGQVNQVCFLEGLVRFKNQWFLYYGTADSKIAVAVSEAGMK
ncbi:MAG: glycosidase [Flavobacterium sp.]|nr:glycosidase [Pedobacter sp.]